MHLTALLGRAEQSCKSCGEEYRTGNSEWSQKGWAGMLKFWGILIFFTMMPLCLVACGVLLFGVIGIDQLGWSRSHDIPMEGLMMLACAGVMVWAVGAARRQIGLSRERTAKTLPAGDSKPS